MSEAKDLLEASKLYSDATEIIATALKEINRTTLDRWHKRRAEAILAKLASDGILLERYEQAEDHPDLWIAQFESWLQKRYVSQVFAHNGSGLGIHKRIADEVKEILEKFSGLKNAKA